MPLLLVAMQLLLIASCSNTIRLPRSVWRLRSAPNTRIVHVFLARCAPLSTVSLTASTKQDAVFLKCRMEHMADGRLPVRDSYKISITKVSSATRVLLAFAKLQVQLASVKDEGSGNPAQCDLAECSPHGL